MTPDEMKAEFAALDAADGLTASQARRRQWLQRELEKLDHRLAAFRALQRDWADREYPPERGLNECC